LGWQAKGREADTVETLVEEVRPLINWSEAPEFSE